MRSIEREPVFLIGFMGAGKSTIGPLLAARMGRRFVDTDTLVEQRAGATIAELWGTEGEAAFRRREAEVVAVVARQGPQVVAVGGGAPCYGDNLEVMLGAGRVVWLAASPEAIVERVGDASSRPLLAGGANVRQEVARLLEARTRFYERADLTVDTTGVPPSRAVSRIIEEVAQWR